MGGEGKWPYRTDKVLQVNSSLRFRLHTPESVPKSGLVCVRRLVNSWLWKFLRTLKNTYENVPTILSKIVGFNLFVKGDVMVPRLTGIQFLNTEV